MFQLLDFIPGSQDILSILPTDILYFLFPGECDNQIPCPVIVRINRIFRLDRIFQFFNTTETKTNYPNAFRTFKIVFYILLLIHWNACLFFCISFYIGFGSDDWVYQGAPALSTQYSYSFYWSRSRYIHFLHSHEAFVVPIWRSAILLKVPSRSTLTLTTIGETPQPSPASNTELLFVTLDFLAGVLIFASIVGNIGAMIESRTAERTNFQNRMDEIKDYMNFRKIEGQLENRVIKWFDYLWANKAALGMIHTQ